MRLQKGFTLLEVMIGIVILTYVSLAMLQGFGLARTETSRINDRAFASQKVMQMMFEIKNMRDRTLVNLDSLNDTGYNYGLSINPLDDPLSDNPNNRYVRKVTVTTAPNDMRQVTVAVYLDDSKKLLAEAMNLLSAEQ